MSSVRSTFTPALTLLWFVLFLLCLLLPKVTLAKNLEEPETVKVTVLSAFSTSQERELLHAFRQTLLEKHNLRVEEKFVFWQRQEGWQQQLESNNPDLLVAIGNQSFEKVQPLELSTPVLALMINQKTFQQLETQSPDNYYAITHSQPIERFVQLAKSLNVYQAQIGSFISPKTKQNIKKFDSLATFYDLSYRPVMVQPKLNGRDAMSQLAMCCSVIILESDCVFRPGKIRKSILVNAYRQRIIVIAHSESVLKEGAMLTLFSQPYDIGQQAANLFGDLLNDSLKQRFQYPKRFSIGINRKIARLLGYDDITVGGLMQKIETLDFIQNIADRKIESQ